MSNLSIQRLNYEHFIRHIKLLVSYLWCWPYLTEDFVLCTLTTTQCTLYIVHQESEQMNVQDLLKRYGLNSRTSLYKRLRYLELELPKDNDDKSFATPGQLKLLDQLHDHIKAGGNMATFAKPAQVDVVSIDSVQDNVQGEQSKNVPNGLQSELYTVQPPSSEMLLESLVGAIVQNMVRLVGLKAS